MKKLISIYIFFFFLVVGTICAQNCQTKLTVKAAAAPTYFARVMAENVYLYKNAIDNEDFSNIYFEIPRTYFVELINDYDSNFYVARYLGLEGYVKKDCVTAISGAPVNPFLTNVCFRVYSEQSQNMRKLPTSSGGSEYQEYFLPQDNLNITYIGKIHGEPYIKNRTDVWFYCKFVNSAEHYGYVYSEFCDDGDGNNLVIPQNNEEVVYIANPNFTPQAEVQTSLPVESKTTWVVIAVLSVPALIFVLLFLKGGKFLKKEKKIANKEISEY